LLLAVAGIVLAKNPIEQAAIELVKELNSRGMSLREIAHGEGIPD